MATSELRNLADQAEIGLDDPVIRQALEQGARERATALQSKVEQSAGLTGAAQVQASTGAVARAFGQAFSESMQRESQHRRDVLQFRLGALQAANQLDQDQLQFQQRLEFELAAQKRQDGLLKRNALIGAFGGIATGFVGSDLFGSFFGDKPTP